MTAINPWLDVAPHPKTDHSQSGLIITVWNGPCSHYLQVVVNSPAELVALRKACLTPDTTPEGS